MVIVGILGVSSLRDGFSGDQALFLIYSKAIDNGAILYKDVWDIKQPAIFVFYLIGGKLFGFNEVGIHLLEIIYWLGFSLMMIFGLRRYFTNPLFAALTPLFTIGIYYSVSGSLHLTQAESLVGFPLFMSLWFCQKFLENPDKKSFLFLSGLFGGIVLTFKLLFILILAVFWLVFLLYFRKEPKKMLVFSGLILSGLILPIASVIVYFALNNALYELWYVTFIYPSNVVMMETRMANRSGQLKDGLVWFFKSYFPVISLTFFFLLLNLRNIFKVRQNKIEFILTGKNFIFSGLLIWAIFGFAVILMQRLSWWEYHYSLLMIPLGILAVKCVGNIFEIIRTNPKFGRKTLFYILSAVLIMPLFIPTARRLADRIRQFNKIESVKIGTRELRITGAAAEDYKSISADTEFLRTENPKARIFVFSNPLYYYLSDTPPFFSSNGAMSDMFTDAEWEKLNREMSEKLPDYIFVEPRFIPMIAKEDPTFINILDNNYSVYITGDRGSFYKLNE
ncbi:hypothetical protein BH20ACI1_BH20ACI1_26630 [soil metagenome]